MKLYTEIRNDKIEEKITKFYRCTLICLCEQKSSLLKRSDYDDIMLIFLMNHLL